MVTPTTAFLGPKGLNLPEPDGTQRSQIILIEGDTWILANAYWDDVAQDFYRVDKTKAAFGIQLQGKNYIPGEESLGFNVAGLTQWVASPAAYDLIRGGGLTTGNRYATTGGWELGMVMTQERQMTLGGAGIEVDGFGTFPYGRVQHYTINGIRRTGLLSNAYLDESGRDDPSQSSWGAGFDRSSTAEYYKIRRAPAGGSSLNWVEYLSISQNGEVVFKAGSVMSGLAKINGMPIDPTIVVISDGHIDCGSGGLFELNLIGSTTLSFDNPLPSGKGCGFRLTLKANGGSVIWPTSVIWPDDKTPVQITGKAYIFEFYTTDAGMTWRGICLPAYSR